MFFRVIIPTLTWNSLTLKAIRSVSDTFLKRSAPNVNGQFSGSAPFLERKLVITLLDSRLACFCQTETNMEYIDPVKCEQLNSRLVRCSSISPSIVHIVSDRFPNRTENRVVSRP